MSKKIKVILLTITYPIWVIPYALYGLLEIVYSEIYFHVYGYYPDQAKYHPEDRHD